MQKIGASTSSADALGEFTEGNPAAGVAATLLKASWLNAVQRELVNLVLAAGLTLDATDDSQVLKAIQALQSWSKLTGKPNTISGFGITDAFTKTEVSSAIQVAIAALVGAAPATLDAINELAAAIGNDPNFAVTMANLMDGKANKATTLGGYGITDAYTTGQIAAKILEGFFVPQGTASLIGGFKAAGAADLYVGSSKVLAVTPEAFKGALANETYRGVAEVATQAETDAGVLDTHIVTPKKLKANLAGFLSDQLSPSAGAQIVVTHNLGYVPTESSMELVWECVVAQGGWVPGAFVRQESWVHSTASTALTRGFYIYGETTTQVTVGCADGALWQLPTKTTGTGFNLTFANWRLRLRIKP